MRSKLRRLLVKDDAGVNDVRRAADPADSLAAMHPWIRANSSDETEQTEATGVDVSELSDGSAGHRPGTATALTPDVVRDAADAASVLQSAAANETDTPRAVVVPPKDTDAVNEHEEFLILAGLLDRASVRRMVNAAWDEHGPEEVYHRWLMPMLAEVGSAWEQSRISVAAEHLVSQEVRRVLHARLSAAAVRQNGPVVLVGTAQGVRHDIGALSFALLLRQVGVRVVSLSNKPNSTWMATMRETGARHIVLTATRPSEADATNVLVKALAERFPEATIRTGGGQQRHIAAPAEPLGDDLLAARAEILRLMGWDADDA